MYEAQLSTLTELNSKATISVATYYKNLNADNKTKLDLLEKALAEIDILLLYIVQVRFDIRNDLATLPTSSKTAAYGCLEELHTVQDAAKTVSYNLTAVVHSIRDLIKSEVE